MKYLALLLLLIAFPAGAAVRTLSGDCSIPHRLTPSESTPFDLDNCTLRDGDDITTLLKDIATYWGAVYVRAPSKTVSVTYTGTNAWSSITVFVLLEDQEAKNKLTIKHVPTTEDATMWRFVNATRVVIGGAKLSVTFVGTHPGLGTGRPCSGARESCNVESEFGLLDFGLTNNSNPDLVDLRANFTNTWSAGLHFTGGDNGSDGEAARNRWKKVNVAGVFLNSSVIVNSGVMDVWMDPDRTAFIDPWVRASGWDGGIAKYATDGTPVGCYDVARAMYRNGVGAELQFTRRITGGVTAEYGFPNFGVFVPKYIGDGPNDPYKVRLKDWGFSGPTEMTGYPSGVMVKHGTAGGPMKHDPASPYNFTDTSNRNIAFYQLPSRYGNGQYSKPIASGCAAGNNTDNNFGSGYPFIWRAEASNDGTAQNPPYSPYVTAYINVTFSGFTAWKGAENDGAYVQASSGQKYYLPNQTSPDRIYGMTLRAASGTRMPGIVAILDNSTITGPGSWYNVSIETRTTTPSVTNLNPINNTITDTHIYGTVTVSTNATNTVISNVDFTGDEARTILVTDSEVTMSNICARAGSEITGKGSVVYKGTTWTLPHTIAGAMNECAIAANGRPNPPGAN